MPFPLSVFYNAESIVLVDCVPTVFIPASNFCIQSYGNYHTIPCAIMALATFIKPAILAPFR
jgi:hypothetical protein